MLLIAHILNFDDLREYQGRGTKHFHIPLHGEGTPKLEDEDSEVIEFIDQYVVCSLSIRKLFKIEWSGKTLQSHHHTQTYRKKEGVVCRFNASWPVTNETLIIRKAENTDNRVLSQAVKTDDLDKVTEKELLDVTGVSEAKYHEALKMWKRRPLYNVNVGRVRWT